MQTAPKTVPIGALSHATEIRAFRNATKLVQNSGKFGGFLVPFGCSQCRPRDLLTKVTIGHSASRLSKIRRGAQFASPCGVGGPPSILDEVDALSWCAAFSFVRTELSLPARHGLPPDAAQAVAHGNPTTAPRHRRRGNRERPNPSSSARRTARSRACAARRCCSGPGLDHDCDSRGDASTAT